MGADGLQCFRQRDGSQFRSAVECVRRDRGHALAEFDGKLRAGCAEGEAADGFDALADGNVLQCRAFGKGAGFSVIAAQNLFQGIRKSCGFQYVTVTEAFGRDRFRAFADGQRFQFIAVIEGGVAERAARKNCLCETGAAECLLADFLQRLRKYDAGQIAAAVERVFADSQKRCGKRDGSQFRSVHERLRGNRSYTVAEFHRKTFAGRAEGIAADGFDVLADGDGFQCRTVGKGAGFTVIAAFDLFQGIRERNAFQKIAVTEAFGWDRFRAFADSCRFQLVAVIEGGEAKRAARKQQRGQAGTAECLFADLLQILRQRDLCQAFAAPECECSDFGHRIGERDRGHIDAAVEHSVADGGDAVLVVRVFDHGSFDIGGSLPEGTAVQCDIAGACDLQQTVRIELPCDAVADDALRNRIGIVSGLFLCGCGTLPDSDSRSLLFRDRNCRAGHTLRETAQQHCCRQHRGMPRF